MENMATTTKNEKLRRDINITCVNVEECNSGEEERP